jgi:hypothetical protein
MLNTVKFIQNNSLEQLISTYNLIARYSQRYPNLVQLCYHQLETPKNEITNECRGLILDTTDSYKVISYPFHRFSDYDFNPNTGRDERADKVLDNDTLSFYEKVDGSLMTLYFYNGEWNVSTKTLPDASGEIYKKETTYRELFFKIFKDLNYELPTDTTKCYIFEAMYDGQGITSKNKETISLLAVRDLITLKELDVEIIGNELGYSIVESVEKTLDEVISIVRNIDPIVCEGYVVCSHNLDENGNYKRFKIKSPQFERISELKVNYDNSEERQVVCDRDNFRKISDIIRTNKHSTFLSLEKYHSVQNLYKKVNSKYKKLLNDTQLFVNSINGLSGKDLGMKLKGCEKYLNGLSFSISQGKIDKDKDGYLEDYFYQMNIRNFEEIVKKIK